MIKTNECPLRTGADSELGDFYELVLGREDSGYLTAAGAARRGLREVTVCLWVQSGDPSAEGPLFIYRTRYIERFVDGIALLNQQRPAVVVMNKKRYVSVYTCAQEVSHTVMTLALYS